MSAPNIWTDKDQRWAFCHDECVPYGRHAQGDVHRCDHGRIWMSRIAPTGGTYWSSLHPFWNRGQYKRAKQALDAAS